MISPEEIKQLALKWWIPYLQSLIVSEPFFPKTIDRIGKLKAGDITSRFSAVQDEVFALIKHSKDQTGVGYRVVTALNKFRRTGAHDLPDSIVFESAEDYLAFSGKKAEQERFLLNYALLLESFPELKPWIYDDPLTLTLVGVDWDGIIKVCRYFISNPRPLLHLRQLPIAVHTKFIEYNAGVLQPLLDFLIPDHIRDPSQKKFVDRFFLSRDEPLIRLRLLDKGLSPDYGICDLSIPLSDFERIIWGNKNVVLTENKMNFLCLPNLPSTIAIWSGGGFMIRFLKNASWLRDKKIFYWGDIDEHGFQILHQLRSYFPQARSILMDLSTFEHFRDFAVDGASNPTEILTLLNDAEQELYRSLKALPEKNRLEQEKIPQEYVNAYMTRTIK
jgi:hypothetical protein